MGEKLDGIGLADKSDLGGQDPDVREELIRSAVKFLRDPKVQKSTLNKKVAFLESKGLTAYEIQASLSRATPTKKAAEKEDFLEDSLLESSEHPVGAAMHPGYSYPPRVVQASSTWKDYFITSVVFGAVGYSLYGLAQVIYSSIFLLIYLPDFHHPTPQMAFRRRSGTGTPKA